MRCLVLLPVVFCSLAQAQGSIAATLYSRRGDTINISRGSCHNVQGNRLELYKIVVRKSNVCSLHRDLNCIVLSLIHSRIRRTSSWPRARHLPRPQQPYLPSLFISRIKLSLHHSPPSLRPSSSLSKERARARIKDMASSQSAVLAAPRTSQEAAPLLLPRADLSSSSSQDHHHPHGDDASLTTPRQLLRIAIPFFLILTAVEFAAALCAAGVAALVEGSLCRSAFPDLITDPYGDARYKHKAV
ncbi:hypothetical protein NHJ13734_009014 [Beauveria thailandica]